MRNPYGHGGDRAAGPGRCRDAARRARRPAAAALRLALAAAIVLPAQARAQEAVGATAKPVPAPLAAGAAGDGGERPEIVLAGPSGGGARPADVRATEIVANAGPISRQWLARFGRSVSSQAMDAVEARMEGGGSHVVLGGYRLDLSAGSGGDDAARALDDLALTEPTAETPTVTMQDLLLGSSFRLTGGDEVEGTAVTAWGQFATGGFSGKIKNLGADGSLYSGFLGLDFGRRQGIAGIALGLTQGSGGFTLDGDAGRGAMKSSLTSVYPYAKLNLTKRLNLWGLAGYGAGKLEMKRKLRYETSRTDLEMHLGAVGARGTVLSPQSVHGFSLVAKSDAFLMQMRAREAQSALGRFESAVAKAHRLRVSLDAARPLAMGDGGRLTPSLRIGLRRDGGDAETGLGVEAAGGLRYVLGRISIEVSARSLLAHGARGYREWGAGGLVRIDPGREGRGLSLTLAPRWGEAQTGIERLQSLAGIGNAAGAAAPAAGRRVEAELGYGIGLPGRRGLLTPYAGLSLASGRQSALTAGARWRLSPETMIALKGAREDGDRGRPEYRVVLHGHARW